MNTRIALSSLLAGLALAAFTAPEDRIEFNPAAGTNLTKTFVTSGSFALDDFSVTMNGEEMDPSMMGPDMNLDDVSADGSYTLVVTDEYVSVAGGRPTELLRTYDELRGEFKSAMGESGEDEANEIQGAVVRFKWNEEQSAYDRTVEKSPEEVDEEDVAMLAEDLDLRALLPARAVSAEDSWTVAWEDLGALVLPGMDVDAAMRRLEDEAGDEIPFDVSAQLEGALGDLAITCTYVGLRDAGGTEVAVIGLALEGEGSVDLTDAIMAAAEEGLSESGMELDMSVVLDYSVELSGELLWNAKAGHAHSMSFDVEAALDIVGEAFMDMMGEEMDFNFNAELSGEVHREVTIE